MAQVWKVYRPAVAGHGIVGVMKLPLASQLDDQGARERFGAEVRVLMLMQGCPNIVQIVDMGVDGGVFYFVMDYVHGCDLGRLLSILKRNREILPPAVVAYLGVEIFGGIVPIHLLSLGGVPQRLCHLDIKPPNVLVGSRGNIKIADFGIAKPEHLDLTNRGTMAYMAPEHFLGSPCQKSDVYSGGLVLWESLEGRPYREGANAEVLRREIVGAKVLPLSRRDVPSELTQLLAAMLAPHERDRPASEEVLARLEAMACYRNERPKVQKLMGQYVAGANRSGHTELLDALPAETTADLAGLLASAQVLVASGKSPVLEQLFRLPVISRRGAGEAPPPAVPAVVDESGPMPPPLFGAPASDDVPVGPPAAPVPAAAAAPTVAEPADPRRLPATVRLSPEVLRLQRERDAPIPIERRPAVEAPSPAPLPTPAPLMPDEGTPHRGRPLDEVHEPSAPHGAATDRVVIDPDGIDDRRTRRRFVVLTAVGGVAAIVLGVTVGALLVDGAAEDARPVARASATPERKQRVATEVSTTGHGPQLLPIASSETPEAKEVPTARPVTPMPAVEVPTPAPTPLPVPPEPVDAPPVATTPAADVAAAAIATPTIEPRAPSPKPKPATPRVEIDIRNEWVEQGIELRIGKTTFAVPVRKITTFPAGRHAMQWRKVGESQWRAVGKHELAKDMRHVILVGIVANAPSGLKIVSKAVAR